MRDHGPRAGPRTCTARVLPPSDLERFLGLLTHPGCWTLGELPDPPTTVYQTSVYTPVRPRSGLISLSDAVVTGSQLYQGTERQQAVAEKREEAVSRTFLPAGGYVPWHWGSDHGLTSPHPHRRNRNPVDSSSGD